MISLQPTLLIVDADASWRELLGEFFEMHSFRVFLAGSGKEALGALGSHNDLILMDLVFSDMSGIELIQEIHRVTLNSSSRILVCGNGKIPKDASILIHSHLPKPVALPLLLSEANRLLSLNP
ncbi:MAG: response regulator [Bdellovibrionales bacterium]|nr:response regulator [Bdellovibrionales bacterium]